MPPSAVAPSPSLDSAKKIMTPAQARSLTAMRSCLTCHLCDKRFTEPATLMACMHSFCHKCIMEYTEDNWYCPVTGCGAPVACKGGSNEAIKKNPIISAVASSLQNIEKIIESAPENWWVDRNDEGHENIVDRNSDDEESDVVDFQMIMDKENSKKRNHEDFEVEGDFDTYDTDVPNTAKGLEKVDKGRKTLSIDQSLFPPDERMKLNPTPPEFSCSPIALQSSQAEASTICAVMDQHPSPMCHHDPKSKTNSSLASKLPSEKTKQISMPLESTLKITRSPTPRRAPRVSFQQQPKVILLNPSLTLSTEHSRCLRKCVNDGFISILKTQQSDASDNVDEFESGFDFDTEDDRQSFLDLLSSNRNDNSPPASSSFYAVSTARDVNFSVGDAIIVPRTFSYYLSVACGLPIVDIEFLSTAANMNRRGTIHNQRYPFPCLSVTDEKQADNTKNSGCDFLVLGASNYTWNAPKKARHAALHRHSLWQDEKGPHSQMETLLPGTDLLRAYSVLLVGDFDQNCLSKRTVGSKRRRQMDLKINNSDFCTRGNICILLQLCGAQVYEIDFLTSSKQVKKGLNNDQIAHAKSARPLGANRSGLNTLEHDLHHKQGNLFVMVKDSSDVKVGRDFISQLNLKGEALPVVSCQWLLDSIGEFEVKEPSSYSS